MGSGGQVNALDLNTSPRTEDDIEYYEFDALLCGFDLVIWTEGYRTGEDGGIEVDDLYAGAYWVL